MLVVAAPLAAQVTLNDHTLSVCAEQDKQTGYLSPPSDPVRFGTSRDTPSTFAGVPPVSRDLPSTWGDPAGMLVGVTPMNPSGDLFTPLGVDRNVPTAEAPDQTVVDLALSIADSPDPVDSGSTVTFIATVLNNGPDMALDPILTINFPLEITLAGIPDRCSGSRPVICHTPTLVPAIPFSFTFVGTANLPQGGTVVTQGSITGFHRELDPEDNEKSEPTTIRATVPQRSDLRVGASFNPQFVPAGQTALYVGEITNEGPNNATGVQLVVDLAAGLTVQSAEPTQGSCSTSGNRVTCVMGALALAAQARVNLRLAVSNDARGTLTTTASVTGDQQDPNPANNQASATLAVEPPEPTADLQVTKTGSADPVRVGQLLRYTIVVNNLGPAEATNVVITDTLPQGTEFANCSPNCEPGNVIVRCRVARIAPGGNGGAFIDIRPTQAGTITNQVTVEGDQRDPNTANNTATRATTVNP